MGKFFAIAHNTFLQTIRQPVYCVLVMATLLVLVMTLPLADWSMGEEGGDHHDTNQRLLIIAGLSTLLAAGWLLTGFSASSAMTREIEDRTALTVVSKPVPRPVFVLGKFAGVASAVTLAYYIGAVVLLMTVRHQVVSAASDPYDWPVIVIGFTALGLALAISLGGNFFFSWQFTSAFLYSAIVCLTAAMAIILFVGKDWKLVQPGYDGPIQEYGTIRVRLKEGQSVEQFSARAKDQGYIVTKTDRHQPVFILAAPERVTPESAIAELARWPVVEDVRRQHDPPVIRADLLMGMGLVYLSLLVLVAVAIAASTRLGLVLTLLVCAGVFLLGSLHPFLRQTVLPGRTGGNFMSIVVQWVLPNLAFFYSSDVLSRPYDTPIPAGFVGLCALYCLLYVMGVLAVGMALFQRREMAAEEGGASVPGAVNLLAGLGRCLALVMGFAGLILLGEPAYHNLTGLLVIGGLLAAAVLGWLFWGYFAHGAKWSFWLVLVPSILSFAATTAVLAGVQFEWLRRHVRMSAPQAVLAALVGGACLLILLLPKTRRHFRGQT